MSSNKRSIKYSESESESEVKNKKQKKKFKGKDKIFSQNHSRYIINFPNNNNTPLSKFSGHVISADFKSCQNLKGVRP